jgi:5-methyltetrahydropteroyltriglutamate--homocysteine methyltransferase
MIKHNLGFPRIGLNRELKKYIETYWDNKISEKELLFFYKSICKKNLIYQCTLDLIPCNDFSLYDHVLDMSFLLGVIPDRYRQLEHKIKDIDLYFSMAKGYHYNAIDIKPMEMTKWFNTNYHYIVPEFNKDQNFYIKSTKIFYEFNYATKIVNNKFPKVVLIGPISFLLLGKEKQNGFKKIDLIENIIPIYIEILNRLKNMGAIWVQLDEPFLTLNISEIEKEAYRYTYKIINKKCKELKILIATYFESFDENFFLATQLPIAALHIDAKKNLDTILNIIPKNLIISLGLIDGINIWSNNYNNSLLTIKKAVKILGEDRIMIAPNTSLLHIPLTISLENEIPKKIKNSMSFATQKITELDELFLIFKENELLFIDNLNCIVKKNNCYNKINNEFINNKKPFKYRKKIQKYLKIPLLPTTTIGSFPQTEKIRTIRNKLKNVKLSYHDYEQIIKKHILSAIHKQEEIGLDILVHGEFERSDMVEYFGEYLEGFISTNNGWIQSYGSRCVKPPIIYDDIIRTIDITVKWSMWAQKNTKKHVKGIITGPITMLKWSFVIYDHDKYKTINQICLSLKKEIIAIESSGINIIQIDEPALKESFPLKNDNCYLSINYFVIVSSVVKSTTQIHTHMCYSELKNILGTLNRMDVDVINIEISKSQMDLLKYFYKYKNDIGPGLYDVHSKIIPSINEIYNFLKNYSLFIPINKLWVNPDCGLKTRKWKETILSLKNMVIAANKFRLFIKNIL